MNEYVRYVRLNEAFQYVSDEFLDIVEQEKRKKRKQPAWVMYSAVAACICLLIVLPVSAMVNNWFGIRTLFVPDPINKYNIISLSGYQGSSEAEALREWNEL